ncbi:FRG domain-containing protein [Myxococcota bacterium]
MPGEHPEARHGVEDHYFSSAHEFLNALSPRYEPLWRNNATGWIFRGQADASWQLQPGAVRDMRAFSKFGVSGESPNVPGVTTPAWRRRIDLQQELLIRFMEGLDRSGLTIPWRPPTVSVFARPEITSNAEPPPDALPLMALAQHHGLPTMFLDWTRRAWVAAYFPAVEVAERACEPTHLAVWALFRERLHDKGRRLKFYQAPGATDPNLHAQCGLFTLLAAENDPSLEEHIAQLLLESTGDTPLLRRLLLPASEARRLLRFLADEGVHGASLFPGPDGVVRWMREGVLWERATVSQEPSAAQQAVETDRPVIGSALRARVLGGKAAWRLLWWLRRCWMG